MITQMSEIDDLLPVLVSLRREFHTHPELGFCEHRTAARIGELLGALDGMEVHTGIGGTGVVGVLRVGKSNRSIGLRADMDALPIREEPRLAHASQNPLAFHGCGHDGHTAILIGAAQQLARTRQFDGTVVFIFQPAEEGLGGGRAMIEDGLFQRFPCRRVFALHNWPDLPVGTVGVRPGPMTAAADKFEVTLECRGGHAAMPHKTSDAILAMSELVQQLHSIVSRRIPPSASAVLSVTQVHAGHTHNVLPSSATVAGTVRTFEPAVQDAIESSIRQVAAGVALGSGTTANVNYHRYYPMTVNDPESAGLVRTIAGAPPLNLLTVEPPPTLGSEDFSFMLREIPGSYIWLGAGRGGDNPGLHAPDFDFNDDVLSLGVALWVRLVEESLAVQP